MLLIHTAVQHLREHINGHPEEMCQAELSASELLQHLLGTALSVEPNLICRAQATGQNTLPPPNRLRKNQGFPPQRLVVTPPWPQFRFLKLGLRSPAAPAPVPVDEGVEGQSVSPAGGEVLDIHLWVPGRTATGKRIGKVGRACQGICGTFPLSGCPGHTSGSLGPPELSKPGLLRARKSQTRFLPLESHRHSPNIQKSAPRPPNGFSSYSCLPEEGPLGHTTHHIPLTAQMVLQTPTDHLPAPSLALPSRLHLAPQQQSILG